MDSLAFTWVLFFSMMLDTSGGTDCPAGFNPDSMEDRRKWKCAIDVDEENATLKYNDECLYNIQQRDFWEFPDKTTDCEEYWGSQKVVGLWHRLTEKLSDDVSAYLNCTQNFRSAMIEKYSANVVRSWPQKRMTRLSVQSDKKCTSERLCDFENSHFGRCSQFFDSMVAPSCDANDNKFVKRYCEEVCPLPSPDENLTEEELADCDKAKVNPFKRSTRCPVKRAAAAVKEVAADVGAKMATWVKTMMPGLLDSPEKAPEEAMG
eukprot:TRINITY_DN18105_c0_g1_i1.p1 TRINITY_DN18105_c0_g1~~TRINITY_DN18105_c0_g1_i1.p1  ORF type:complete len:263 (-),score=39.08 TRINITY_DN18105_c0_g1_i1:14-802(-)